MILLTLVVLGTVATLSIPLELFPSGFTGPFLEVVVPWRDAPSQEMLEKVVLPLEEAIQESDVQIAIEDYNDTAPKAFSSSNSTTVWLTCTCARARRQWSDLPPKESKERCIGWGM